VRAYAAIYETAGLERYAPGGQLSKAATDELADTGRFGLDDGGDGRGPHGIHIIVNASRVLLIADVKARGDRQMAEGLVRTCQACSACRMSCGYRGRSSAGFP
jgi:hypothetical protein